MVGAVAGLALLGTLSSSLSGALSSAEGREAAAITFVVAASGLTFLGIGAAFWALAAGLLVRAVLPRAAVRRRCPSPSADRLTRPDPTPRPSDSPAPDTA